MPFIHPILFWLGVGGIAIPIAIHLLNRRRLRIVDWAAMRFLLEALRKNRRRLRIEELLLLALRCAIVVLLGVALGRFTGCNETNGLGLTGQLRSVVFVLDDSASMGQRRGETDVFAAAVSDLQTCLSKLSNKDRIGILLTSRSQRTDALLDLGEVTDRQSLLTRLSALRPGDLRTRLSDAMQSASDWLAGENGEKHLYVYTDFRRVDLADTGEAGKIRTALAALNRQGVRTVLADYGREARSNLTLEALEPADRHVLAGRPVNLRLAVRNNGTTRAEGAVVQLAAQWPQAGKMRTVSLPVQSIDSLEPGQVCHREVTFTPAQSGFVAVSATLPADDLPGDNSACLCMEVRLALKVLLVDGKPNAAAPEEAESYFLRTALDPTGRGEYGFDTDVIPREALTGFDFQPYDVVFLLNVPDFPLQPVTIRTSDGKEAVERYASARVLEDFVRSGGGLAIFTGDRIDTGFYNSRLFLKGRGLCPALLRPSTGDPSRADVYVQIDPPSVRSTGVLRSFSGDAAGALQLVRFFAFTPVDETALGPDASPDQAPVIEARFNDRSHSPAVISRRFGRGQVVLIASTASLAWNDWAMDSAGDVEGLFVLFAADLAETLARPQTAEYTRPTGTAIRYPLDEALRDAVGTLIPPGAGADLVTLTPQSAPDGRLEASFVPADTAGMYRLRLVRPDGVAQEALFARNTDPLEGRLSPAGKEEIAAALGHGDYIYVNRSEPTGAEPTKTDERRPYWMWAVAAALACLALETFLARRFGHW